MEQSRRIRQPQMPSVKLINARHLLKMLGPAVFSVGLLLYCIAASGIAFAAASSAAGSVLRLRIDGPIHPVTEEYVERGIAEAQRRGASAILMELNTPGGLLESTRKIVASMLASPIPVIVYVTPSGSRAASAGLFLLEAADVAAMAPGTNTGAAHPVVLGGGKPDDVMKEKIENDAAALMRSVVAKRGRNVELAEAGVRESKSFTEQESLKQNLIDVVAADEASLFQQINGHDVTRFNGDKVRLNLSASAVTDFGLSLREQILAYLLDPNVAFLLFAIGMLALYAEFNHPGAVIPGVVGAIFILLAIFALHLLPLRFAAVVLLLGAMALFALEAKFATHGVLGVGGIVALVLGALMLVDGPIAELRVRLATALGVGIPLGAITVFLMRIAVQARRNKVTTGSAGMIGQIGVARTALAAGGPAGKVFVHGELWNATSAVPIAEGDPVTVKAIDGLLLEVEE